MEKQASALDKVLFRFVAAAMFGVPVGLMIVSVIGLTNEVVDLGIREKGDSLWIYGTLLLCIFFGFVFNIMERLIDMVKTKSDSE